MVKKAWLKVSASTRERVKERLRPGETYDEFVNRLIDIHDLAEKILGIVSRPPLLSPDEWEIINKLKKKLGVK